MTEQVAQLEKAKEAVERENRDLAEREGELGVQLERIIDEHLKEMGILRHSQNDMTEVVSTLSQQCQLYQQQIIDAKEEWAGQV